MKKVCIIGFSESTRDMAPVDDDSWEFWGMNHLYPHVDAPWTRWFEMHTAAWLETNLFRWPDYPGWLKELSIPLYMVDRYESFPSSIRYPREKVEAMLRERFLTPEQNWSASTPAYALLLAALEGADQVAVFGVDMIKDTEWGHQRPNMNLVVGLLRGSGIPVHIAPPSVLVHNRWQYGYEEPPEGHAQLIARMENRLLEADKFCKEIEQEIVEKRAEYHEHLGALKDTKFWLERLADFERGGKL